MRKDSSDNKVIYSTAYGYDKKENREVGVGYGRIDKNGNFWFRLTPDDVARGVNLEKMCADGITFKSRKGYRLMWTDTEEEALVSALSHFVFNATMAKIEDEEKAA